MRALSETNYWVPSNRIGVGLRGESCIIRSMSIAEISKNKSAARYKEFVVSRLRSFNFYAEEKLKRIDALADFIFAARTNYNGNRKA